MDELFLKQIKEYQDFPKIRNVVKKDLYSFLVGDLYGLAYQEPIKTSPVLVVSYLHLFLSEGIITNEQINSELAKIKINKKENLWLILEYIEAQVLKSQTNEDYLVKIDVDALLDKVRNVDKTLKEDYTVRYILKETKERTGYAIEW